MEPLDRVWDYIKDFDRPIVKIRCAELDSHTKERIQKEYVSFRHMWSLRKNDTDFIDSITNEDLDRTIPYVRMNRFGYVYFYPPHLDKDGDKEYISRSSMYAFVSIFMCFLSKNPKGWVIDLRNNPGGVIEYFLTLVSILLNGKTVYMNGVNSKGEANSQLMVGEFVRIVIEGTEICNIVVPFRLKQQLKNVNILINKNTASAAEIMTIIMRDHVGATVYSMMVPTS